ncbi:MAG: hypothetical protein KGJ21_07620 [Pseudomonadota bacterium]|nr:hypothetical protein [Pseudomonadota bacterium]
MTNDKMQRKRDSAMDFDKLLRPKLEAQMKARIFPVDMLQEAELVKLLDQKGVDAFYMDKDGDPLGLASRFQYSEFARERPSFTFRYGLWDEVRQQFNRMNAEYQRKLRCIKDSKQGKFFPVWNVESWKDKKTDLVEWSYMAKTRDLMLYIERYLPHGDRKRVYIFEPKTGEKREVVVVNVAAFKQECEVVEVKS